MRASLRSIQRAVGIAAGLCCVLAILPGGGGSTQAGLSAAAALAAPRAVRWADANGATPARVAGLDDVVAATADLALHRDGSVTWWNTAPLFEDMPALDVLHHVAAISEGVQYGLAVETDGSVWSWGVGCLGELGHETQYTEDGCVDQSMPTEVSGLFDVVAVAAGSTNSLALQRDGSVWTWGSNVDGEMGLGSSDDEHHVAVQRVPGLAGVVAIAAGDEFDLALKRDGTVWGWGQNGLGQLGRAPDSDPTFRSSPLRVPGLPRITAIAAGMDTALALDANGKVWSWGLSFSAGDTNLPAPVGGLAGATGIAASDRSALALLGNGQVWAWGDNSSCQLGNGAGDDEAHATPVRVPGLSGISMVAGDKDGETSAAVAADGTLWAWGCDQSGDATTAVDTDTPAPTDTPEPTATATPRPLDLAGAGSTLASAALAQWARGLAAAQPSDGVSYRPAGDTPGLSQWLQGKADFVVAAAPLSAAQVLSATARCANGSGLVSIPAAVGAIAVVYNLPTVQGWLRLSPDALSNIFLGHMRFWRDERLRRLNPRAALPAGPIRVLTPSTTGDVSALFLRYIAPASSYWQARVPANTPVQWAGQSMSQPGDGAAQAALIAQVARTPGSIALVDLAAATAYHLPMAAIWNRSGDFVEPGAGTLSAAAASVASAMPPDLRQEIVDASAPHAYPIASYLYLTFCGGRDERGRALLALARAAIGATRYPSAASGYAPLPPAVQARVLARLAAVAAAKPVPANTPVPPTATAAPAALATASPTP